MSSSKRKKGIISTSLDFFGDLASRAGFTSPASASDNVQRPPVESSRKKKRLRNNNIEGGEPLDQVRKLQENGRTHFGDTTRGSAKKFNRQRPAVGSLGRKRPTRNNTHRGEEPLDRARELQQNGTNNHNRHRNESIRTTTTRKPEFHSPLQASHKESLESAFQGQNEKDSNSPKPRTDTMVDLCGSNSDTEDESMNTTIPRKKQSTPSRPLCSEDSTTTTSERTKDRFRQHVEKEQRKQPVETPGYPRAQLCPPIRDSIDGNEDDEIELGDTTASVTNLQERIEIRGEDSKPKSLEGGKDVHSPKDSTGTNEMSDTSKAIDDDPIRDNSEPRKHQAGNGSIENIAVCKQEVSKKKLGNIRTHGTEGTTITIPALKPVKVKMRRRKKRKQDKTKFYADIDDTEGTRYQEDVDRIDSETETPAYLDVMGDTIQVVENSRRGQTQTSNGTTNDSFRIGAKASRAIAAAKKSPSSIGLNLTKINNKRTKLRKKCFSITPGASLNKDPGVDGKLLWRCEQDQDEYHTSNASLVNNNRKPKDEDAQNWNPHTGKEYGPHPALSSRSTKEYGTDVGRSQASPLCLPDSPRRRSMRVNRSLNPVTIDILSSDSEDDHSTVLEEHDDSVESKFPLKRLGIVERNRVFNYGDHETKVKFNNENLTMEISYFASKNRSRGKNKITIHMNNVEELTYFPIATRGTQVENTDPENFVFLVCNVKTESSRVTRQRDLKSRRILLEFDNDQDLEDFNAATSETERSGVISEGNPIDVEIVAELLIKDSRGKSNKMTKRRGAPSKKDPFISGRKSDEILVVYPFEADREKVEDATKGLTELAWKVPMVDSSSQNNPDVKSHYVEIRVEDYEQLNTGQWLNDSLIDMWMQWISRDTGCNQSSDVHFFTSHFYTTLVSEGTDGVKSWTAKKNINIFKKKMIFIPINKTLHWSLCVLLNPGAIIPTLDSGETSDGDRPLPCMLFFDSLNMHRKHKVHKHILGWLNFEWKRTENTDAEPFQKDSFRIFDPNVPRQNNGSDCGVFVCRYAFAMLQLRPMMISYRDAGLVEIESGQDTDRKRSGTQPKVFSDLITNGESFGFNVDDIQRIRKEFKVLIQKLQPLYKAAKDHRIKVEKEEKKARRESRRKEKDDNFGDEDSQNEEEPQIGVANDNVADEESQDEKEPQIGVANNDDSSDSGSSKESHGNMNKENLVEKMGALGCKDSEVSYDPPIQQETVEVENAEENEPCSAAEWEASMKMDEEGMMKLEDGTQSDDNHLVV